MYDSPCNKVNSHLQHLLIYSRTLHEFNKESAASFNYSYTRHLGEVFQILTTTSAIWHFRSFLLRCTSSCHDTIRASGRHEEGRLKRVLRFLAGLTKLKSVTHEQLKGLLGVPHIDECQSQYCKPMKPVSCYPTAHYQTMLFFF